MHPKITDLVDGHVEVDEDESIITVVLTEAHVAAMFRLAGRLRWPKGVSLYDRSSDTSNTLTLTQAVEAMKACFEADSVVGVDADDYRVERLVRWDESLRYSL